MKIGFIGAGKVGFSLGKYFAENGAELSGYYSRTESSAHEAAAFTGSKAFMSSELQVEMPKQGTASFGIETPNATFADMTTFLMASKPSTSAVGSASA